MTFEPEFKKALSRLPEAEKDKLILRLLKYDLKLANRLHFELVDTDTVRDKREMLRHKITNKIQLFSKRYFSPGYLLIDIRSISGMITEHVFITKDKFGEISLNCLMLRLLLEYNNQRIRSESTGKSYNLNMYIISRIFKILILLQKQHEDLHMEYMEDIVAIGRHIADNPQLMTMAIHNGLDVNWLIQFEIPDNVAEIYRSLREKGF